jgi:hypothetical protein
MVLLFLASDRLDARPTWAVGAITSQVVEHEGDLAVEQLVTGTPVEALVAEPRMVLVTWLQPDV